VEGEGAKCSKTEWLGPSLPVEFLPELNSNSTDTDAEETE
jgi:hypothetical protein